MKAMKSGCDKESGPVCTISNSKSCLIIFIALKKSKINS